MSAFVISEVETRDHAAMESYRTRAARSIALYGGRYLARGVAADVAEGAPSRANMVVVEFESMARLREWYASAEYAEALQFRPTAFVRRLIFTEGVQPA